MVRIPIKIKKGKQIADKIADEFKVDLRNGLVREIKQPSKKWLFLSVGLIIITIFLSWAAWSFYSQKMPLANLIPEQALAFGLIKQEALCQRNSVFGEFMENGAAVISQLGRYLDQSQLDFERDIKSLFKDEVAFACRGSEQDLKGIYSTGVVLANDHHLLVLGTTKSEAFRGVFCHQVTVHQAGAQVPVKGHTAF